MRKTVILFMLITIPLSAFMTVQQVFKNEQIQKEVRTVTEKQRTLFEKNKQMLTNIAILKSPARINELAKNVLHLKQLSDKEMTFVEITSGKEGRE